jgi:hypothetical protein
VLESRLRGHDRSDIRQRICDDSRRIDRILAAAQFQREARRQARKVG